MVIETAKIPKHWNYFLCIEDDLLHLSRWIEFAPENFGCFSVELARLLMTCSSEVDVVAKALCARISQTAAASSINRYRDVLASHYRNMPQNRVFAPRYGLTLSPWTNWAEPNSPPDWWLANNKIKHHRDENFHLASLQHTLNAAAGLFTLLILYYSDRSKPLTPVPRLFHSEKYAYRDGDMLVFLPS